MLAFAGLKRFGTPPLFDPAAGVTVREPLGQGAGWWAGVPSAMYDDESSKFYLYYRLRKPRELGRAVERRIAQSDDGRHFADIWQATKEQIDTASVETSCLAISFDLRCWQRITTSGPFVTSPYGCIRYVEAVQLEREIFYYHEYTRPDGSHQLRANQVLC